MTAEQTERKLGDDERGAVLRKPLEKIRASSRRLDRMISDLLDASRIEARQLSLSPRLTDMRALIVAATDRSAAVCAGHPVRMQLPDQMPPVEVDPDRVEQVLTNLLSNAGKYSREGTAIVVTATARPPFLEVAVSNLDGRIDPADAKQIFTRFYRAEGAAQRAPGLGMGLYIAKGLVQAHGGDIWVEPDGDRTTFRFTLPLPRSRRPLVSLPRSRTADS
jgi:signal transduction histidine kinase